MQQRGIVHPDMLARLQPNFYPSLCTILVPSQAQDAWGQVIGTPSILEDYEDLPCRIAPASGREQRSAQQVYVEGQYHIALNGYYPAITEQMIATVNATEYNIEHVEHDGNQKTTRIMVRLVT